MNRLCSLFSQILEFIPRTAPPRRDCPFGGWGSGPDRGGSPLAHDPEHPEQARPEEHTARGLRYRTRGSLVQAEREAHGRRLPIRISGRKQRGIRTGVVDEIIGNTERRIDVD